MDTHQLQSINALSELERFGIQYAIASDNEVKCKCPFHDDDSPSCFVNIEKNLFKCQTAGCGKSGDILSLLARFTNSTRRVVYEDLSTRYTFDDAKIVDSGVIERYHQAIWTSGPFLTQLYNRGLTDDTLRKYRIGFADGRITIPIKNEAGLYVNIRKYLPGAPGKDKMRNQKGRGKARLYPIDQLKFNKIIICGGEVKALAVAQHLNDFGFGAIAATAGEGGWEPEFTKKFKDKEVWVCFDVDDAGRKAANSICARLKDFVSHLYRIDLPLDRDKYPKGDVNDFLGGEKKTAEDLLKVISDTGEWVNDFSLDTLNDDDSETIEVPLIKATRAKYTGKKIKVTSTIGAIAQSPYVVPKTVNCLCGRNEDGCSQCPVFARTPDDNGYVKLQLHPESPAILEICGASKSYQRDALMQGLKVPACKDIQLFPIEFYNVEDVRLRPQLNISNRSVNDLMQPALCVGHGLELNEDYCGIGRMYPHPKTQESVLLMSKMELTQDALSNYSPLPEQLQALYKFTPEDDSVEAVEKKLKEIYTDLSANVTRIFERQDLHLAVDLVYHSALLFNFDGKIIKGWTESLILGDSSQGKSETAMRLKDHYSLGEKMDCKNATVSGLLGGLQQMGSRWFVTWGIIPTHDKMLVVLEELKGASIELLSKLTDMRSSGIAEIPKIEKRRTHARTRLLALSNPRSDRPLASYNFGIAAVKELIGGLEDVRRFDFALLVSSHDIPAARLNFLQSYRPEVEHVYKAEDCRRCVLWAWTREHDDIVFDKGVHDLILKASTELCTEFDESIPLVDKGGMRYKIARLSIALAARLFSTDNTQTLIVRKCHVQYILNFIRRIYNSDVFGYKDYSDAIKVTNSLLDPEMIKRHILQTPFPSDVTKQLLYTNEIDLRDIQDWCGWDRGEGMQLLSVLVRKHALQRDGRGYRKTPAFIILLKDLLESDEMKTMDRPDFIKDEF